MPTIYTFSTSWFISLAAFFTSLVIFKKWKGDKNSISFGLFWLMATGVWFFAGLEVFLWWREAPWLAKVSSFISEFFIVAEGPFLIYYLVKKSLNREALARFFFVLYVCGVVVYYYFALTEDLPGPSASEWGWKFAPAPSAFITLQILYTAPTFFVLLDFLKRIVIWIRKKHLEESYLLLSTFSLIVYMGVAYFDAEGGLVGWPLMLIRIIILSSVLMSYLAYSVKPLKHIISSFEV